MNTYLCFLWHSPENATTIIAETRSKARYKFYKEMEFVDGFKNFLGSIRVKLKHKFQVSDLFGDNDQFERMKIQRGIEFAKIGMGIIANGKPGIICGSNGSMNLNVCFDGEYQISNCHPHWKIKYLDENNNVITEY